MKGRWRPLQWWVKWTVVHEREGENGKEGEKRRRARIGKGRKVMCYGDEQVSSAPVEASRKSL